MRAFVWDRQHHTTTGNTPRSWPPRRRACNFNRVLGLDCPGCGPSFPYDPYKEPPHVEDGGRRGCCGPARGTTFGLRQHHRPDLRHHGPGLASLSPTPRKATRRGSSRSAATEGSPGRVPCTPVTALRCGLHAAARTDAGRPLLVASRRPWRNVCTPKLASSKSVGGSHFGRPTNAAAPERQAQAPAFFGRYKPEPPSHSFRAQWSRASSEREPSYRLVYTGTEPDRSGAEDSHRLTGARPTRAEPVTPRRSALPGTEASSRERSPHHAGRPAVSSRRSGRRGCR
jgi:hypothetical protein